MSQVTALAFWEQPFVVMVCFYLFVLGWKGTFHVFGLKYYLSLSFVFK